MILVDDRSEGLDEIRSVIQSTNLKNKEFTLHYFDSFKAYKKAGSPIADVVFLDYYLEIDDIIGSTIVDQVHSEYIVGFSSMLRGSTEIKTKAIESGNFPGNNVFAALKRNELPAHDSLYGVMNEIMKNHLNDDAICH